MNQTSFMQARRVLADLESNPDHHDPDVPEPLQDQERRFLRAIRERVFRLRMN